MNQPAAHSRSKSPKRGIWSIPVPSGELIPLSLAEIRRLLNALIWIPTHAVEAVLTWSHWRRRHQARARRCHYETRTSQLKIRL